MTNSMIDYKIVIVILYGVLSYFIGYAVGYGHGQEGQ